MTDLQFYRFEIDNDSYGSNYGYAIANPMQFSDVPDNLVIYVDRDTNEWVGYSDEQEFGPDPDIDTLFQDVASAVGAIDYDVIDTDDDDDSGSIEVASIEPGAISRRQARFDSIDYGIDIDFESMTVAGRRQNVLAWKKDMMDRRIASIEPGWKMLDFGLYELQNGKSDTFVSEANDGRMHLYSNGLDFGAFDDADAAMADAPELLDHYDWSPELPENYWPIDEEDLTDSDYSDRQASRTARVWKLDLDAPLSMQDKKTFLDNDIDVNEDEEDDGTVVLTMTGADGAVADTAELLGLTDDFAQDAYSDSASITSPIDEDDYSDDEESEPAELPEKIDDFEVPEDEEVVKPDDETEKKIKDGIIDLLDEWKNDRKTGMTASRKTCPICLQTSDDLVHCDAIDLDVCPDCCEACCAMSDEQDKDKTDRNASVKKAHIYVMEFDGIYDEPIYNETDDYYDIGHESVLVEADSESEAKQKIIDKFPNASDIRLMYDQRTHPATPEIYDSVDEFYEKFPYSSFKTIEKTETMPGYKDWMDDASDHVEASVKTSKVYVMEFGGSYDEPVYLESNDVWDTGYGSALVEAESQDEAKQKIKDKFPNAYDIRLDYDQRTHSPEIYDSIDEFHKAFPKSNIERLEDVKPVDTDWMINMQDSDRNASVKKAHSTDIQMMLGEDGYYWHLTVKDDSGNVVKEEDYATEELASEAASDTITKDDDIPVKDVDGLVVPEADSDEFYEPVDEEPTFDEDDPNADAYGAVVVGAKQKNTDTTHHEIS